MPKDYPRSDRISQQIKKEIADILSIEIKDPALKSVSIIDVEVAHDLKMQKFFMSQIIMMRKLLRVFSDRYRFLGLFWQKGCQLEVYQNSILNMIKQLMKV